MHLIDYLLIVIYLATLLALGFVKRLKKDSTASQLIVGGRVLTLPAFVASLVSTWYGGILGVGEYSYLYGLSNWLVFGLPYYLYTLGLVRIPAHQAALITLLEPVLVPVWTYLAVSEKPPVETLIGGAIILAALVAFVLNAGRNARDRVASTPDA